MTFQHPQLLWLLLVPALFMILKCRRSPDAIPFPGAESLAAIPRSAKTRLARFIPWLHTAAIFIAFVALARPQMVNTVTTVTSKGVDIVLAIDLSSSMLAVDRGTADRSRTRLAVAKEVTRDFISRRGGDRISIVAFGARAYPVAPLTLDHDWLTSVIEQLEPGSIEDGTALGDGLLAAINRLHSSPAGSRTVVLVTDGRSNTGNRGPAAAASAAAALGIKVYTIGIGGKEGALFPVEDPLGGVLWREVRADLDESGLREIASTTDGRYFSADGAESLRSVFLEIDRLEKGPIEEKSRRNVKELFPHLLCSALFLMMLEQTLLSNRLRRLP